MLVITNNQFNPYVNFNEKGIKPKPGAVRTESVEDVLDRFQGYMCTCQLGSYGQLSSSIKSATNEKITSLAQQALAVNPSCLADLVRPLEDAMKNHDDEIGMFLALGTFEKNLSKMTKSSNL